MGQFNERDFWLLFTGVFCTFTGLVILLYGFRPGIGSGCFVTDPALRIMFGSVPTIIGVIALGLYCHSKIR